MPAAPLVANDLVRTLGTRRVLDGVCLVAAPGQRIGLIGENGAGKSTLLRLLAGVDQPDAGTVVRPPDLGYLPQELPFDPDATLADVIANALRDDRELLAMLDQVSAELAVEETPARLTQYAELLARAEDRAAWDADRRAELVLAGLGLGEIPPDRRLGGMSGGQRARLLLGALLVRRPTALLLDEPTNHLDDAAAEFLEEQLRGTRGVVVAASHDRAFLDAVCTDVVDLDPAIDGPTRYGGNYTAYHGEKLAERDRWRRRYAEEQAELTELREAAETKAHHVALGREPRDNEKMGYGHRKGRVQSQESRRTRNAARRVADLERTQVPRPPEPLRFHPKSLATLESIDGGPLVAVRGIEVPGRLVLDRLDVSPTDRLLVTGPNGAGKSTLLAVLAGRLQPRGEVRREPGVTVRRLAQETRFGRPERTAVRTYELAVGIEQAAAVPLRSLGLLAPEDLRKRVGELSIGQRRRLALALLLADPPHLLVLDEPTNHLSPALADDLEAAFGTTPGALVLASHDRRLRSTWTGRELHLEP
ncbi:macrolide transport system ATP-binding/permease protein [Kribbella amoyensis]|uniref:Macrolide transport system ATP-binding/permease protein n=1 Tax=Kribbella amoyensis TaxID=996641 RepID=A0A561B841_9ACTN|nr:ABC-F family ATP-binding cassette domain-containing protein [Kribbella amoyensis]TWD75013.1 macrolide transport system ATP-binding/permease protein [Kribbella amoyensis]